MGHRGRSSPGVGAATTPFRAWLVDPAAEVLEAYALQDRRWLRLGGWSGDDVARIPPFDAIELELTPLWVREAAPP